ncbi:MAG: hypothetical protein HeimC2_29520 [Candidatus Heimdallarchaeota archaeon LC_2]|nr:MAG: hypothetical protein HeimC2_29520 [Candidatus Heimdallarchaeota archaeon LC_2]
MQQIPFKDFKLIQALQTDPLISMKELASKIDISWPTVKKRYNRMVEEGIIGLPVAIYKVETLGLIRMSVIAKVWTMELLKKLELACDIHPYTHYRSRFFGEHFGLLMQFDVPNNSEAQENLKLFLDELLMRKNIIYDYDLFASTGIRTETYPDLQNFDHENQLWKFNWQDWFSSVHEEPYIDFQRITPLDYKELSPIKLNFLRTISANGGIKQTELRQKYELSRTDTHRIYNFVMNKLVSTIRLNYNHEYFDLTETFLVQINSLSQTDKNLLYYLFKENPPPYRMALDLLENDKALIWGNLTPKQSNEFLFLLWETFPSLQSLRLDTNQNGSMIYWFYPQNFNFEQNDWKFSYEYMFETPMKEINEKFS